MVQWKSGVYATRYSDPYTSLCCRKANSVAFEAEKSSCISHEGQHYYLLVCVHLGKVGLLPILYAPYFWKLKFSEDTSTEWPVPQNLLHFIQKTPCSFNRNPVNFCQAHVKPVTVSKRQAFWPPIHANKKSSCKTIKYHAVKIKHYVDISTKTSLDQKTCFTGMR